MQHPAKGRCARLAFSQAIDQNSRAPRLDDASGPTQCGSCVSRATGGELGDALTWLQNTALPTWIREGQASIWGFPMILTVHTAGLMLLVGASLVLDLRLLGVARRIPLGPMRALFPLMWAGFWVNAVTGSLLFAADASAKGASVLFLTKLLFVALGAMTMVLIRRDLDGVGASPAAVSPATRRLAVVSILSWAVAVTAGRLLAYV